MLLWCLSTLREASRMISFIIKVLYGHHLSCARAVLKHSQVKEILQALQMDLCSPELWARGCSHALPFLGWKLRFWVDAFLSSLLSHCTLSAGEEGSQLLSSTCCYNLVDLEITLYVQSTKKEQKQWIESFQEDVGDAHKQHNTSKTLASDIPAACHSGWEGFSSWVPSCKLDTETWPKELAMWGQHTGSGLALGTGTHRGAVLQE